MFRRNFLCFSLCPLPLVLSLGTTEKSLAASSWHPPLRYLSALKFCCSMLMHLWSKGFTYLSFILSCFSKDILRETEQNKEAQNRYCTVLKCYTWSFLSLLGGDYIDEFLWIPHFSHHILEKCQQRCLVCSTSAVTPSNFFSVWQSISILSVCTLMELFPVRSHHILQVILTLPFAGKLAFLSLCARGWVRAKVPFSLASNVCYFLWDLRRESTRC